MPRISKHEYYLGIAKAVAQRSTCLRKKYGAVIVKNDEIISTGYNGSPRGEENCIDVGTCYRIENNIPSGTMYEKCKSVHAEQNAIISASRNQMMGSLLYLYGEEFDGTVLLDPKPCSLCERFIKNAGIKKVINIQSIKE